MTEFDRIRNLIIEYENDNKYTDKELINEITKVCFARDSKTMKLIDIINKETDKLNYETHVDYRTFAPDGTDIFTGYCVVNKAGEIIASDGDTYSIEDEFIKYKVCVSPGDEVYLECWYESEWICG